MKNIKDIKQVNKLFAFGLRLFRIQSLSVYRLTLSMLVITAVFSVGFIFSGWIYTETLRIKTRIKELQNASLNKQKEKLKTEVHRLISYLEFVQQDTIHHSLEQIKEEALRNFENMRFENDSYVFVNTYDGIALLFDGQRTDKLKNITELTDPNGFKIFEKELELAKLPEGGSFQYLFKKIYTATPQAKLSYVMGFDKWQWIIGTGGYLNNVEEEVRALERDLKRDMYRNILIASGVFIFVLFVLVFVSYWFARGVQYEFNKFVLILKQAPLNKNNKEPLDRIFIRELKTIGFEIRHTVELAKQFGDIIDQSINEIYIFDQSSFKFVHVNRGAIKNCGYSLSELQSMTPLNIKPELNLQQFQDLVMPLIQKKTNHIRFETVHQRKNKTLYPVDVHLTLSFFKGKSVFIAFIYDISERKETERQLHSSQQRYSGLFENAPISLWEEDFSDLIEYIDKQKKFYKLDIEQLFEQHPEVLFHCSGLVKVIDVNKQTLSLFEAENKNELFGNLNKLFTEASIPVFKQSLLALYRGDKQYSSEGANLTLKGRKLDVLLRWSFLSKDDELARKVIISFIDLTDLRKKEEDLIASEARFRSIFENNHTVMFLINPKNGRFIDANPAALKFYGYTHNHFLTELSVYDLNTLSKEETIVKMNEVGVKKQVVFNFKHQLANGEIRDVEVHSGIIQFESKPTLFSIVHDITGKKQAEDLLIESKNKMESIFRAAPIGIGVVSNRVFTEVNDRFCEITGFSAKELIGKESAMIYPLLDEFERVGKEKYEQIRKKGTGTVETKFKRKDGKIIDVLLSSTPLDMSNFDKGVTFTALDITERVEVLKELENHKNNLTEIVNDRTRALEESQNALLNLVDDLNRQSAKLATTNTRLAEINKELETFTYSVSHDLKAPLRGIDGYSQLLQENYKKDLDTEALEFLENIRKSTQQMNMLIEDLLAYSRMERKTVQPESIQFKPIIDNLLLIYSKTITENKVQVKKSFPDDFVLLGDKNGISLVLRNLLDNALKFSTTKRAIQIEIGASESDTHWHIFVKDNGIGFDMNYHDRIFKIFQRLHLPEEYEGTGIGLAIVNKAVQRMNGRIWAESEKGKGSCFYVEIEK